MKKIVGFLAAFVLVVFVVVVIRETAAVVALARDLDPRLGPVVLWTLLTIYTVCLAVPAILFFRLPTTLVPPESDTDPRFPDYLTRLGRRLARNAHLRDTPVTADRVGVNAALATLDTIADEEIRREASLVFLSTAISQSGRLDALFVLVVQTRLVWKVARVYRQRPSAREMLNLYAAVALTIFAAESLEDLELGEVVEPMIPPLLEAAGVGATVVLAPVATILADSLLQGTVNALLTFRVGAIAKRYSAGMPLPDRKAVRKAATREAATKVAGVASELSRVVTKTVWDRAAHAVGHKGRAAAGRVTVLYEALRRMAGREVARS